MLVSNEILGIVRHVAVKEADISLSRALSLEHTYFHQMVTICAYTEY